MKETSETSEILEILRTMRPCLIGIDGVDGSGKSSLASLLSTELGWSHINLDDYVEKNLGRYVNHIHYDEVRNKLNNTEEPIIIEGVCLLAVLERLERHMDLLIYVKNVAHYGRWYDEEDCAVSEDIEDFMNRKKEDLQRFVGVEASIEGKEPPSGVVFPELTEEIIRYHHKYTPHERADIVYKRIG